MIQNRSLKVALSHDIDRTRKSYQYITKFFSCLINWNLNGLSKQLKTWTSFNNYWTFDDIIDIENQFGVKSTFFFLNESIKLNPFKINSYMLALGRYNIKDKKIVELIQKLHNTGWEIGLHGSYNSYKDYNLLLEEKATLEKIISCEIKGTRQHYLNLNQDTWRYHNSLGLKYDSSLGFNGPGDKIGFVDHNTRPFRPFNNEFMVIPQVIMDSNFMANSQRWIQLDSIVKKCIENDAYLVVNYHNHVFNENEYPGYRQSYIELLTYFKELNARFYTLGQVYELEKNIFN